MKINFFFFIEGTYGTIVKEEVKCFQSKIIFMHNNTPSHSAKTTNDDLNKMIFNEIHLMKWAAYSVNLNPTENLLSILKRKVYIIG